MLDERRRRSPGLRSRICPVGDEQDVWTGGSFEEACGGSFWTFTRVAPKDCEVLADLALTKDR
jgi:hypothetical protein